MKDKLLNMVNYIYKKLIQFAIWFKYIFIRRYRITVSFNNQYGDGDDRQYIAKKIIVQKEKHLRFVNEDGKKVEFRSSGGLNFIVEDYDSEDESEEIF
jgi:hypothetical protein